MRIRNIKNKQTIINNCTYLITEKQTTYFKNNNPIHLEIGMGKGIFILNMALNNPHINFIGVEKFDNVIAKSIKKIGEKAPDNLLLLREDALNLNEYFNKTIDTIYLNFSDPWPKKRQEKRRLTSKIFLDIYDQLFKNEGILIQKTDNVKLFEYSILSLNNYGYKFIDISLDLANTDIPNIKTEYEEKFSKKGYKINYLKAKNK